MFRFSCFVHVAPKIIRPREWLLYDENGGKIIRGKKEKNTYIYKKIKNKKKRRNRRKK